MKAEPELYERIGEEETFEVNIVLPQLVKRRIVRPEYRRRLDRSRPPPRWGARIPRQTMVEWMPVTAMWLQAIYVAMRRELLAGNYLQCDETPIRCNDPDVRGKTVQGLLWALSRRRETSSSSGACRAPSRRRRCYC